MNSADQLEFTNPRVNFFAKSFSEKKCTYFRQKDPVLGMGLHSALMYMTTVASQLADINWGDLNRRNRMYLMFTRYDGAEWALGLVRSILLYQREALDGIDGTSAVVVILYLVVMVVVLLQYVFLGRKMTSLMTAHKGLSGIVMRFVNEASQIDAKLQTEREHKKFDEKKLTGDDDASGSDLTGSAEEEERDLEEEE